MFGHKHYVPILKGKRGEFNALGSLKQKSGLTPLIELVPPSGDDMTREDRLASSVKSIVQRWGCNDPLFIDCLYLAGSADELDEDATAATTAPSAWVEEIYDEFRDQGCRAIPVTGTSRSPSFQAGLKRVVAKDGRGLCIRLIPDDFDDDTQLHEALDALLDFFEIEHSEVDLLVDHRSVAGQAAGTVRNQMKANLAVLPRILAWRTLTVAAGAFPVGIGQMIRGQWNSEKRSDWLAWEKLVAGSELPRKPSFSDYGMRHPDLPPDGVATLLVQLRYASTSEWMVWKGTDFIRNGNQEFFSICADLVSQPFFSGPTFSHADGQLDERAANAGSGGNPEMWNRLGINHHVEMVLHQIANHPSL